MTSTEDLYHALDVTAGLIDAVEPQWWDSPTPCTQWRLHQVVEHIIEQNNYAARAFGGSTAHVTGTLAEAFRRTGQGLINAIQQDGVLETIVSLPIGSLPAPLAVRYMVVEVMVHGWDVATATRQHPNYEPQTTLRALEFARAIRPRLQGVGRAVFQPVIEVNPQQPLIHQLAGILGRDPRRY